MPDVIDGQHLIDSFLKLMPSGDAVISRKAPVQAEPAPDAIVEKLRELGEKEPLWDGVWDYGNKIFGRPYPSQSEADFALLGALVRHAHKLGIPEDMAADAVMRVFEQSGLYRPEKRNRVVRSDIPKLIASDYPATTTPLQFSATVSVSNRARLKSGVINFSNLPPSPRDYVLEDLILARKVSVLAGLGGVSKTMWLMQVAVSIALGRPFFGKQTKAGSVLLILGEEDQEEIDRRFNAICVALSLNIQEIEQVKERVWAYPMNGLDARLTKISDGSLEGTDFPAEIIAAAEELVEASRCPLALLGLDHAGLIHGGEFNAREDVVRTMQQAQFVAQKLGVATLVLAHSPKSAIGKENVDQLDVSGSAAWADLSRAVFVLRTMTDAEGKELGIRTSLKGNYVSFSVVKTNYGPTGEKLWLQRSTVANYGVSVLLEANLVKPQPISASGSLNAQVKAFIKVHPGQYTKTSLRDTQGGKSGPFKVGKNIVAAAVEDLLAIGELRLVSPTDQQRGQFGLRPQVTQVLEAV